MDTQTQKIDEVTGWEFYKPKKNRVKLFLVGGFVIGCLVTPMTNWMLVPMFKVLNKFPLWIYR